MDGCICEYVLLASPSRRPQFKVCTEYTYKILLVCIHVRMCMDQNFCGTRLSGLHKFEDFRR